MSVFQLISFLFCFRYSGHNSVLYIELCLEYLKHVSFYRYHVGLGGNCFILSFLCLYFVNRVFYWIYQNFLVFNIPCQGWGGGDVSYRLFISCIKIILKYSAYQCCMPPMADQLSSCCTVIDIWSTLEIRGFSVSLFGLQ